jgi:type IV pilus assembly protein PilM
LGIFNGNNDFIGVDVGSNAVRLVQLRKTGDKFTLVSFGSAGLPANVSQSDSKLDMQKVAQIVQQLVRSSRVSTKNVVTALPGSAVFSTVIKMPPMSTAELSQAVKYQAEQNIPLKVEDVRIDWQIVRKNNETNESAVMVVAAPKVKVDRTMELFGMAALDVMYLETTPIATARALSTTTDPLFMIVDIGGSKTELTIVENGVVTHVRTMPSAGYAMTRSIAQNLGLDAVQAEQFKLKFGLSQDKLEGQVLKSMKPILGTITDEIQRSIKFYQEQYGSNVGRIVLTGGSSRMPELTSYLKSILNIEVVYGNPWSRVVFQPELTEKLNGNAAEFACAVGLAMREN